MRIAVAVFLVMSLQTFAWAGEEYEITLRSGEFIRRGLVYQPEKLMSEKAPLLLALHGGRGDAGKMKKYSLLNDLADLEGFIVAYPEGRNKHWNDGRNSKKFLKQDAVTDDVAFIDDFVAKLVREYPVDETRIYAMGISNGGFMCQRLAIQSRTRFAAVVSFISSMSPFLEELDPPERKLSVMLMCGTEDPLVPYEGGKVKVELFPVLAKFWKGPDRGDVISAEKCVKWWADYLCPDVERREIELEDKDPDDGCKTVLWSWKNEKEGHEVVLVKIRGGGHTIPQKKQYLSKRLIGATCQDFDGIRYSWDFLKRQRSK